MKTTKVLAGLATAGAAIISAQAFAAPIVYTGTQQIGTITANYSITTDGTTGFILNRSILGYSVSLLHGSDSVSYNNTNGMIAAYVHATPTNLFLVPDGVDSLEMDSDSQGTGELYLDGIFTYATINGFQQQSSEPNFISFATATPAGAVPEPASWAMMILGMGAVGYTMRRRKAVTTRVQFA